MLWVLLALAAATLQAARNGLSRELVGRVSPALTAWSRFAFHLPFATGLAVALGWRDGWPSATAPFLAWAAGGAVAQVLGNLALVAAFQVASFSQSVALHKLEVVFGAALGLLLFGEVATWLGWGGILLSTAGVLLMNRARPGAAAGWLRAFHFDRGTLYALLCGLCFALASFLFKEAIEALLARNPELGPGRFRPAAHTVLYVAWIQVALTTPAIAWMQPGELARVRALWRSMLGIGLTGFLGTLCWFWAFGLTLVAYVRAVGQVEAAISIAIAALAFREAGLRRQLPAIAAIVGGVALVLLGCGPAAPPPAAADPALAARAAALHRDALVVDGHNDVATWILDYGVAHVSDETFWDVLETTRAPVIASHSSARAIADHPRNLSDEMLRAVARNGGVVMVNFSDLFVDPHKTRRWELAARWIAGLRRPVTPLSLLADHVEHVARVAGIDHVGLGSDFDGVPWLPEGMEDVSCFPNLTLELLRRGWSEADLRKLLGENSLRVLEEAEAAANR